MEKQFKKLLQNIHSNDEDQNDPLLKTFEGALFEQSAWFLQTEENPIELEMQTEMIDAPKILESKNPSYDIKVLFVGDSYDGEGEDLLGKMISAMKFGSSEFARFNMEKDLEEISDLAQNLISPSIATQKLLDEIKNKNPQFVVSLGAIITNILLGSREKLSAIHGQFLSKEINGLEFVMVPIFHPDFLMINPNMKRTAWIDLQKVMERVGKI